MATKLKYSDINFQNLMVTQNYEVHATINYNVTPVFRLSACYIRLVLWMLMKKHISALVYIAIICDLICENPT